MPSPFDAVADRSRRRLLDLLLAAPRSVGELRAETGLTQPATSQHLKALREAGLVSARVDGRRRIYELRLEGVDELARWLTPYVLRIQQELEAGDRATRRLRRP
jgi:DNA-binding transcriptional ArsR family regulator